jgi:hypothetical protein
MIIYSFHIFILLMMPLMPPMPDAFCLKHYHATPRHCPDAAGDDAAFEI